MRGSGGREKLLSALDQTATRCNHSSQRQTVACVPLVKRNSTETSFNAECWGSDRAMIRLTSATRLVWLANRFRRLTIEWPNENP